jgi:hypothetical protein
MNHSGAVKDEDVDAVFKSIFRHSEHRLAFYLETIRCGFKQMSRQPEKHSANDYKERGRPSEPRHWEGLIIKPHLGPDHDHGASGVVSDRLSDNEDETLVTTVFSEIESLFGASDEDTNKDTTNEGGLREFLKDLYAVIKHPKQRPAVKNYLGLRLLKGKEATFSRVWGALLFMCRTFHTAVVMVELAAKVKGFTAVQFLQVPENTRAGNSESPPFKRPLKVVKQFGLEPNSAWARHFQGPSVVRRYKKLLPLAITVHAETQLIYYTEGQDPAVGRLSGNIFTYRM